MEEVLNEARECSERPSAAAREGEEIADLLSAVGRSFKSLLRALPGSPAKALSMPQRDVLVRIGRRPGSTPASVSERTGRDRGQVSRLVAELVGLGLIVRTRSERDGRSVVLNLTEDGDRLFERMLARRADLSQSMLAGFGPAEKRALHDALTRIRDTLSDIGEDAA